MDKGAWRATVHGVTKELGVTLVTKQPYCSSEENVLLALPGNIISW